MFTPDRFRPDFPSLRRSLGGRPLAYLDGPGGSQVPRQVVEAITDYYSRCNANTHGEFITSRESDVMLDAARDVVATFLGAADASTVSFGANMTTLNFALSRGMSRVFKAGDEVVITQLDHEGNRGPWLALAEQGVVIREAAMRPDGTIDQEDLRRNITPRTRLVAMGLASNALGTVTDISLARAFTREVGAWLLVDAVHYAPHFAIDVQALDVDFLLCSAYKFYGPHVGILYARPGLLATLKPDSLRTQTQRPPYMIETGTLNHAAIAGVKAAVEYIARIGVGTSLRPLLVSAWGDIGGHERKLAEMLYDGLRNIPGVTLYGPPFGAGLRAPTISFTMKGRGAAEVSRRLGEKGICTWDGHFYAARPIECLGLGEKGGVTRAGILLYTVEEDVQRLLEEVRLLA
jgi:cysteine desulfurase family protein (TIGR01976 family)